MYSEGMLPKIRYADAKPKEAQGGWHIDPLVTTDVKFFPTDMKNNFDEEFTKTEQKWHTVSFIYVVQKQGESIYFAYDRPYTFSVDLKSFMSSIRNDMKLNKILRINSLCKTIAGTECKMLTITSDIDNTMSYYDLLKVKW